MFVGGSSRIGTFLISGILRKFLAYGTGRCIQND
jgi:hypothetical protein